MRRDAVIVAVKKLPSSLYATKNAAEIAIKGVGEMQVLAYPK